MQVLSNMLSGLDKKQQNAHRRRVEALVVDIQARD